MHDVIANPHLDSDDAAQFLTLGAHQRRGKRDDHLVRKIGHLLALAER